MTREETIEAIKVMQAYVDGKEIQTLNCAAHHKFSEPEWDWEYFDYCIIDEPLEKEPQKIPAFSIGDYVEEKETGREGIITERALSGFRVGFDNGNLTYCNQFGQTEEGNIIVPRKKKPFDWRGKNIQWVRFGEDDSNPHKVTSVCEYGVYMRDQNVEDFRDWNYLLNVDKNPDVNWQWSDDNQTWRNFK
jgi:hypothetical protein